MDIEVVCAIIRENNKYLIARRPEGVDLEGYWEFPGGKVQKGEEPEKALIREIHEELGVTIRVKEKLGESRMTQPSGEVILTAYSAERVRGKWTLNFHSEMRWVEVQELRDYPMAPLDLPFVDILMMNQWPIKVKEALALKEGGNLEGALQILQRLAEENPTVGLVFYHLGEVLGELGRDDEALVAYERAVAGDLRGNPRRRVYMGLILSYWQRGLNQRALDTAKKALKEFPDGPELRVAEALALHGQGRHGEAVRQLLELLAVHAECPEIQLYRDAFLYYARNWTS